MNGDSLVPFPEPWRVGVVIPACNEEATIVASIAAARHALATCRELDRSWIVIVCDSCTDRTEERARQALGAHGEIIKCSVASAGTARRLGAAAVIEHFADSAMESLWIANTDADTCVPGDWLERQLSYAARGCAAVAGIVAVERVADCSAAEMERLFADYEIFPDGTHPHVHGANMGVRADAYLEAGGWSDKALAEDHCLWQRLRRLRWPVASSASLVVTTSGRLLGRAAGGFADSLRTRVAALYG